MTNYNFRTTVNKQEAEALKEMIFKRARERAKTLNEETQNSYTEKIQTDIMDFARKSFVSEKNPFTQIKENKAEEITDKADKRQEIELAKERIKEIKAQINNKNKVLNQDLSNIEIQNTMLEARNQINKKSNFIGALDFLNSQASIALVKNRGQNFEAVV